MMHTEYFIVIFCRLHIVCIVRGQLTLSIVASSGQQVCVCEYFKIPIVTLGVIMMSWLMYMKLFNVKEKLKKTRKQHLENFHNRTKVCHYQKLIIL